MTTTAVTTALFPGTGACTALQVGAHAFEIAAHTGKFGTSIATDPATVIAATLLGLTIWSTAGLFEACSLLAAAVARLTGTTGATATIATTLLVGATGRTSTRRNTLTVVLAR